MIRHLEGDSDEPHCLRNNKCVVTSCQELTNVIFI